MKYKKDFTMPVFEKVLTEKWQKTGEIAKIVGCCRKTATDELNLLLLTKQLQEKTKGIPVDIEMMWVPGGKDGTRAWRKTPKAELIEYGKKMGKVNSVFENYRKTCKYKIPTNDKGTEFICDSRENRDEMCCCNAKACPMLIRR